MKYNKDSLNISIKTINCLFNYYYTLFKYMKFVIVFLYFANDSMFTINPALTNL